MTKQVIMIAIAGASGSGKSTLAKLIISKMPPSLKTIVVCQDSYYFSNNQLTAEQRRSINYDHPKSFDWDLIKEQLTKVKQEHKINVPRYDYINEIRLEQGDSYSDVDVVIFEGIYAIYDQSINDYFDIKIFVDTPKDECLTRRLLRDINDRKRSLESVIKQWRDDVSPMYDKFIEPSKKNADLVIMTIRENSVAVQTIMNWILKKV
ncbi:cytidine kinase [Ureaplasma diversum]|uniref:Uridine kinase n=1 Tax=Ureaplasma diversum TaxID=42094 RepID=A0A0C5RKS3_9BACT|nr:uridine kinase [Ureaplasma diversum]AJQ45253.1 cytidine kinase [Ureaplasma diversum]